MSAWKMMVVIVLVLTGGLAEARAQEVAGNSTPDHELGLSKTSVFDVSSPAAVVENTSDPGERPVVPRVHAESPPIIPHGIGDFLPITLDSNLCVDCHLIEEKSPGEPTPIPASHYTDLRLAPSRVGDALVGARRNCVTCHVSLTAAKPLVESRFEPRTD